MTFPVISRPLFPILMQMLPFLSSYRTNRSVICVHNLWYWFHIIFTILSHFLQLLFFFLPPGMAWHYVGIPYWKQFLSDPFCQASFFLGLHLPTFKALTHAPCTSSLPPSWCNCRRRGGTLWFWISPWHIFLKHEWGVSDSVWTEKLQTDVLFSHLATWRCSCSWPPTLFFTCGGRDHFLYHAGVFVAWGKTFRSCSWRCQVNSWSRGRYCLKSERAGRFPDSLVSSLHQLTWLLRQSTNPFLSQWLQSHICWG